MKRKAKKVEQKAWKWENMYPQFVSIVETGANFIPFSSIKFSADEIDSEYTEGYDIAKIVFNTNHTEQHAKQFLEEKNVVDYELKTDDAGKLYVDNPNLESFSDVKVITMQDGIEVHVGKTDKATVQSKTKIEEAEPMLKMSDEAETVETVALESEVAPETEEVVAEEATDETDLEEVYEEGAEETVVQETTEEVVQVENKFADNKTLELLGEFISTKMSDNEFTNYVDAKKTYLTMELLSYKLMDSVFYALQEEDRETKVLQVAAQFGEAVLKLYNALDTVNMSSDEDDEEDEDEEDLDQTGAKIIGEEEPEVLLEASTTEVDTITPAIQDLSSELKAIKAELDELKKQKEVDSTNVLMQTSKADVGAFDKSPTLEDNKPGVYANNTKNLFGL